MSNNIIGRVDEMGKRIDDVEKSINEIMNDLGEEDQKNWSMWSFVILFNTSPYHWPNLFAYFLHGPVKDSFIGESNF